MASIQFKDIRKSYGDVAVVHGISLNIRDGEFIVFSRMTRLIDCLEGY